MKAAPKPSSELELSRVVACLAHDVRHSLDLIPHYVEELQARFKIPPTDPALTRVLQLHKRATAMLEDALLADHLVAGNASRVRTAINLNDVVVEVVSPYEAVLGAASIKLSMNLCAEPPTMDANHFQVVRLIDNVVGNAIRHTPSGGTVTVTTAVDSEMVTFSVADTGKGLPPDVADSVGKSIVENPADERSINGLGLYIVRSIVEHHRGTLTATTGRNGTTLTTKLPRREC